MLDTNWWYCFHSAHPYTHWRAVRDAAQLTRIERCWYRSAVKMVFSWLFLVVIMHDAVSYGSGVCVWMMWSDMWYGSLAGEFRTILQLLQYAIRAQPFTYVHCVVCTHIFRIFYWWTTIWTPSQNTLYADSEHTICYSSQFNFGSFRKSTHSSTTALLRDVQSVSFTSSALRWWEIEMADTIWQFIGRRSITIVHLRRS